MPRQPSDHSTVSAYLMVPDADRLIAFLRAVFGADVTMRLPRDDGKVMHASIRIGDSTIMLSDATAEFPPFPVWLHVYVDEVDRTFAQALSLGASPVQEPSSKGDGDQRGGFKDFAGNIWWIATPDA